MFKFGRKEKSKTGDDHKKERRGSKKEKKNKDSRASPLPVDSDSERYTTVPPPVAPKPKHSQSSVLNVNLKNTSKPLTPRGILKFRSSSKHKDAEPSNPSKIVDDPAMLHENTRRNEQMIWKFSPDKPNAVPVRTEYDRRKRESVHSLTVNISPPNIPPPTDINAEKVYSVNLQLPEISKPSPPSPRDLSIHRQPRGDFGFNLRWAPYVDYFGNSYPSVVFAEPGTSGEKSGVIPGDRIISINDINVENCSRENVISLIQNSDNPLNLRVQQIPESVELNKHCSTTETHSQSGRTQVSVYMHTRMTGTRYLFCSSYR